MLVVRLGLGIFFAMNVMALSLPTWAPHVYGASAEGEWLLVLRMLSGIFAIPVLLLLGGPIAASAWRATRTGVANGDLLVTLAVVASFGLSVIDLVRSEGGVYFDTATTLLVVVTLGQAIEAQARVRAEEALRTGFAPKPVQVVRLGVDGREQVSPALLVPGDRIEVPPGAAIPTDGVVEGGEAGVDESMLTGESLPVVKRMGCAVAGGTMVIDGTLRLRVTLPESASTPARLEELLARAREQRSALERVADRGAAMAVPLLLVLALAAGLWWARAAGSERGVLVAVSVLVVACPCGLALAAPVAVRRGIATAARRGLVLRDALALEAAAAVGQVVFDKTGTLTTGEPEIHEIDLATGAPFALDAVVAWAAAVERDQPHPFARAIVARAQSLALDVPEAEAVRVRPGRGVGGEVAGRRIRVEALTEGQGTGPGCAVWVDGALAVTMYFTESLRAGARAAVEQLRRDGRRVRVATGDRTAAVLVPALFRPSEVAAGLSPEDKLERLGVLRAAALREGWGGTAMVGDGVNDAPALGAADLGVAVAGATDLTRIAADVVILNDDPALVPWLLQHARRVRRAVVRGFVWAFVYNALAIGLAVGGRLDPVVAALAMVVSSAGVLLPSRRL